jgi:tetratricopeptide (TPR) repeat protein
MSSLSLWKRGLIATVLTVSLLAATTRKSAAQQDAAAGLGPNADANAYVEAGENDGKNGHLDEAVTAFEKAISLDPKFAPAYYNLGYAKSLQNKTDEALDAYSKTIALAPDYLEAYNQRGNLKGKHGDFPGAISDFLQVVRIKPDSPQGHYNLGHVYYFMGDSDNATKELNKALALDPKFAFAYFIRGLIRHAQNHNADATADFRKSLGLNFPDAAFWIYICQSEDGLGDAAKKDLATALTASETFKPDDFPTAIGNFLLGHLPQDELFAKAAVGKPEERDDFTCAAWFYSGIAQRLTNNIPGARDCFTKAINTNSKGSEEYVEAKREIATLPGL